MLLESKISKEVQRKKWISVRKRTIKKSQCKKASNKTYREKE